MPVTRLLRVPARLPSRPVEAIERELLAFRLGGEERLASLNDLLLGTDVLTVALLGHHVRVRVEAHRRVVTQLRRDLDDREPPFVDQQRRERMPQVVRTSGCE